MGMSQAREIRIAAMRASMNFIWSGNGECLAHDKQKAD